MAVLLVNQLGRPLKTRAGSAFVARNRRALQAVLPPHAQGVVKAIQLATYEPDRGDYWRVPMHAIYQRGDEVVEFPQANRDYVAVCEAQRTVDELYEKALAVCQEP